MYIYICIYIRMFIYICIRIYICTYIYPPWPQPTNTQPRPAKDVHTALSPQVF